VATHAARNSRGALNEADFSSLCITGLDVEQELISRPNKKAATVTKFLLSIVSKIEERNIHKVFRFVHLLSSLL